MPFQPQDSPLGAFLKALREEKINCLLIGAMAAIQQGAPLMTVDFDFWVNLPERHDVRLLTIVQLKNSSSAERNERSERIRGRCANAATHRLGEKRLPQNFFSFGILRFFRPSNGGTGWKKSR